MPSSALRRQTAAAMAAALITWTGSGTLLAAAPSTLTGRVVTQNGADPRAGVVVALIEPASERAFRSSPTDARGAFTIEAAPAGNYALVVEAPEGAFLAASNLVLAPGMNRPLSLALKPGKQSEPPADAPPAAGEQKKGALPMWAKGVIAGGIVVGAAIIVDAVTNDDSASQFVTAPPPLRRLGARWAFSATLPVRYRPAIALPVRRSRTGCGRFPSTRSSARTPSWAPPRRCARPSRPTSFAR